MGNAYYLTFYGVIKTGEGQYEYMNLVSVSDNSMSSGMSTSYDITINTILNGSSKSFLVYSIETITANNDFYTTEATQTTAQNSIDYFVEDDKNK
jgi:hypothetical protein